MRTALAKGRVNAATSFDGCHGSARLHIGKSVLTGAGDRKRLLLRSYDSGGRDGLLNLALYLRSVSVLTISFGDLTCHRLALHVVECTLYCVFESHSLRQFSSAE